jgi:integration host factor subunit alpha
MQTITRAHLAETIYAEVGLSRNESAALLEVVLERMARALESGNSIKISGFGTFSVRQKGRRIGRNPKTGVEVPILPRRVLVFRPSQVLKAKVNGRAEPLADEGLDRPGPRCQGIQTRPRRRRRRAADHARRLVPSARSVR